MDPLLPVLESAQRASASDWIGASREPICPRTERWRRGQPRAHDDFRRPTLRPAPDWLLRAQPHPSRPVQFADTPFNR